MSAKPLPEHKQRECIALRAQGLSWGKIGEQMGCSPTTVRKYCREASQLAGDPEAVEPKGGPTDEVNTPIVAARTGERPVSSPLNVPGLSPR